MRKKILFLMLAISLVCIFAISVNAETTSNGDIYNLNGQKVATPMKGLYIMNGKKIVIK